MILFDRKVIEFLNEQLLLPFDSLVQDWDIEMADASRIIEFITFYKNNSLSKLEKKGLMSLIIASFDDYLNENNNENEIENLWNLISVLIQNELELFLELIQYWSSKNEAEDSFKIARYLETLPQN